MDSALKVNYLYAALFAMLGFLMVIFAAISQAPFQLRTVFYWAGIMLQGTGIYIIVSSSSRTKELQERIADEDEEVLRQVINEELN